MELVGLQKAHADAAGNAGLRLAPLPHAAAVFLDQVGDGDAAGRLVAAWLVHVTGEAIELGAVAAGVAGVVGIRRDADRLEPLHATVDDVWHVGAGLDVVDDGWLAKRAFDGRKRRLNPRPGPL